MIGEKVIGVPRVQFREGQVLHAADLNDESGYLLSLRRRHDAGHHIWGIVQGLRLEIEPSGFVIQPGFAWDGYGRPLIVQQEIFRPWRLPGNGSGDANVTLFQEIGAAAVDVWLLYQWQPLVKPGCADQQPTRLQETTRLCFTAVSDGESRAAYDPQKLWSEQSSFNPREPWGVIPADLNITAHQELKDNPQYLWPVYLGTLHAGEGYSITDARRPYAQLKGQRVISASRRPQPDNPAEEEAPPPVPRTELILDGESTLPRPHRFAVRIADENGKVIERLAVEQPGKAILRGNTTLISDTADIPPRTNASDWTIAAFNTKFNISDICNPEAILCRAPEFYGAEFMPDMAEAVETATPSGSAELAVQFLNTLVVQPELSQVPVFNNIPKRIITENLLSLAQLAKPPRLTQVLPPEDLATGPADDSISLQLLSYRPGEEVEEHSGELEGGYIQSAANHYLLNDLFGPALCSPRQPRAYTLSFRPLAAVPKEALSGAVYRTDIPPNQESGEPEQRQLRFEFPALGEKEHPERGQFAVGYFDGGAADKFRACLSIDESCTLKLASDMFVYGDIVRRPPPSPPGLGTTAAEQIERNKVMAVTVPSFTVTGGSNWSYQIQIKNDGNGPLRDGVVLEYVQIGGAPLESNKVSEFKKIDPNDTHTVTVPHSKPLPGSGSLSASITVIAYLPDGSAVYGSGVINPISF